MHRFDDSDSRLSKSMQLIGTSSSNSIEKTPERRFASPEGYGRRESQAIVVSSFNDTRIIARVRDQFMTRPQGLHYYNRIIPPSMHRDIALHLLFENIKWSALSLPFLS